MLDLLETLESTEKLWFIERAAVNKILWEIEDPDEQNPWAKAQCDNIQDLKYTIENYLRFEGLLGPDLEN